MAVIGERVRVRRERPAFYALGGGRVGDVVTLLHPPYTAWHLSYFALGAAVAPHLHVDRLLWGLAAFTLAVGVAAHAFDELHDRPLGTRIGDGALVCAGVVGLAGAVAIGVAGVLTVTAWLVPLVLVGALFAPAYNLELGGRALPRRCVVRAGLGRVPGVHGVFRERGEGGAAGAADRGWLHGDERGAAASELGGARAAPAYACGERHAHFEQRQYGRAVGGCAAESA